MSQQIFYAGPNRQPVPAEESDIPRLLQTGSLTPATLVWQEGMTAWEPLEKARPDLIAYAAPPPPVPGAPVLPGQPLPPPSASPAPVHQASIRAHEIDYKIFGEEMQIVEVELDPGETVIAEAGSMNYMDDVIQFETKMGDGSNPKSGFWDKLKQVGKRAFTGESLFMTHFTNRGAGKKHVAFGAPYPGKIIPMDLRELGGTLFCQKDAFLCAALGTRVGIAFAQKIGAGLFGGEGFILQKLEGDGKAFVHAGGTIIKRELRGDRLLVDTGCLVAFTPGVDYNITRAGNLKSMVFGGEGLFLCALSGHGTVWLQSLPFARLADRILSQVSGGRRSDEGGMLGGLGNLFGD